jgi:uncharacterized membrane protein YfcA
MLKDILLLGAGFVVGSMNAIAGGGMLLGFPAMLAYGLSALTANATGPVAVLPGQIASAYGYRKYLRKTPRKYAWLLVPLVVGAAIGSYILRHTSGDRFEELVPWLVFFAVGLFAFQPLLHHYLHKHLRTRSKRVKPLVIIGLGLLPVGIYGGYFGPGLGFLMLAFLGFTRIHDAHQMNAMKNVAATFMCVVSIAVLSSSSLIDWRAGLIMAVGSTIGGYCGARFAQKISSHAIRVVVIVIGTVTAAYLALRSY